MPVDFISQDAVGTVLYKWFLVKPKNTFKQSLVICHIRVGPMLLFLKGQVSPW